MSKIMKDGKPSTSFSRQDREWVKAIGGGGGGGDITVEALNVTENGSYTAPEGKAYSPVTVEVASDFSIAEITFNVTPPEGVTIESVNISEVSFLFYTSNVNGGTDVNYVSTNTVNLSDALVIMVPVYKNNATISSTDILFVGDDDEYYAFDGIPTITGGATYDSDNGYYLITSDCTLSGSLVLD